MVTADRIRRYVERLPLSLQEEVLRFVEYLLARSEGDAARSDDREWSRLSLSSAMRGLEDETSPNYSPADLKESF